MLKKISKKRKEKKGGDPEIVLTNEY